MTLGLQSEIDDLTCTPVNVLKTRKFKPFRCRFELSSDIDEVILCFAVQPSYSAVVKKLLKSGKRTNKPSNPDEVVAAGAGWSGVVVITGDVKDVVLLDVTHCHLVSKHGESSQKTYWPNTTIPTFKSQRLQLQQMQPTGRWYPRSSRGTPIIKQITGTIWSLPLTDIPAAPLSPQISYDWWLTRTHRIQQSEHLQTLKKNK